MKLSAVQCLLLCNVMYMKPENGPFGHLEDYAGKRLRRFINDLSPDEWCDPDPDRLPMTSAAEWRDVVNAVKKDSVLMNLKILCVHKDTAEKGGGCRSAVFLHGKKEAAVVFEGTEMVSGSAQWKDNFESAGVSDTVHQRRALRWYRRVYKEYGLEDRYIVVTGHSKGGNKAKYTAVRDDTVQRCISFNGEGFSDSFFDKYGKRILKRQAVIENHNVNYDYVSLLLNDIGKETYYLGYHYGSGGFAETHMANTFLRFDEDGLAHMDPDENGRPKEMKAFDEFCNSWLRSMDHNKRLSSLKTMNAVMDAVLSLEGSMSLNETVQVFLKLSEDDTDLKNIAYFTAYLIRYERQDPQVAPWLTVVLNLSDLEGIVQYVQMADQVIGWQTKIFFAKLDFLTISTIAATIVRFLPQWLLSLLRKDMEKRGLSLSMEQLKRLQLLFIEIEVNLRTVVLSQAKADRAVTL